ncbi:MAG: hypothetical protein L0312_19635, partial [Acidobacteria bacterium]|nr:hypothetical protein [Acidobacteriota bacterium]
IIQIDVTNTPEWYRFDVPNSALSSGAVTAGISIIGSVSASNVAQLALEIQLQNTPADVIMKAGVTVSVSTLYPVVVRQWDATSVSSSNFAVTDFTTRVNANVQQWGGISVSASNAAVQNQPNVNVRQVQNISLSGSGTAANPWVPIA